MIGRAGISSKSWNCDHFEGKGDPALQLATIVELFHRESLIQEGAVLRLVRYPYPPSQLEAFFSQLRGEREDEQKVTLSES